MKTKADELIETLAQYRRDLIKYYFEWFGEDMQINDIEEIEHQNYLISNPIQINDPNGDPYGTDSEFQGAGRGKLIRPDGFYSDQFLYEFITHAEGKIGLQWVTSYKGDQIARRCGINGINFCQYGLSAFNGEVAHPHAAPSLISPPIALLLYPLDLSTVTHEAKSDALTPIALATAGL